MSTSQKATIENLDTHVRESLRGKILSGELHGGAHLSELKISKEYNVSRTPVREALCALAADGLVEMIPHRGAFVKDMPQATIEDQKWVYCHFMALAARFATTNVGIDGLMDLENAATTLNTTAKGEDFVTALTKSLGMLRAASQSPMLDEAIDMVERRMNITNLLSPAVGKKEEVRQSFTYLLGALKRRKAEAAEKTMRELMETATGAVANIQTDAEALAQAASDADGASTVQAQ